MSSGRGLVPSASWVPRGERANQTRASFARLQGRHQGVAFGLSCGARGILLPDTVDYYRHSSILSRASSWPPVSGILSPSWVRYFHCCCLLHVCRKQSVRSAMPCLPRPLAYYTKSENARARVCYESKIYLLLLHFPLRPHAMPLLVSLAMRPSRLFSGRG